ncbi:MAG: type II CRISPR RNA-guided endonuclease Cas9 [Rhodopila sp.]|nr:type II CRISPR RNA-guided endonuclease Cas9 [Rhodopila sp.]
MKIQYRLGLDLGANSIGWCALRLDAQGMPCGLLSMGVRVYPDGRNPKDGSSLAAQRRLPRSMRRNRDRYLRRRANLLNALTRFGLMPADEGARRPVAACDPYTLRAAALHRRLEPYELGRVLFHLNQHRGFKSNRKLDRNDNDGGLIKDAAAKTMAALQRDGFLTIGSWLANRHAQREGVRVRLAGSGKTKEYPFYPTREMVAAEFDTIWAAQAGWNPTLTDAMRDALHKIIFHQRPLKPVRVGKCWLEPGEYRAPRALPTAQRYRIAQTLSHLRLAQPGMPERVLTDKERSVLTALLYQGKDLTLDRVRRLLGLPPETDFNTREETLVGCATASRLGNGKKAPIGEAWHALNLATQDAAATIILEAETDEQAIESLVLLGVERAAAAQAAKTALPDGHAALSALALGRILPKLEAGLRYDEAVQAAGYAHHSDRRTGEVRERLPYYGELLFERIGTGTGEPQDAPEKRLGRAPNPTVHVALNEVRRVVNAIVEQHGAPAEIVVETLRELGRSAKQRREYEKIQKQNRDENDDRRKILAEMGLPDNGANRMRLRLWKEQAEDPKNRVCPYSGTIITARAAFSDAIEEDHILPFAITLDDGAANRILVTRESNRAKGKRTPFEAFGHGSEWAAILERAKLLPEQKRWRFAPDALEKFVGKGDFLARHLTDSATIARWAKDYLDVLAPGKVWTIPGRLTGLLRHALGLTPHAVLGKGGARKERDDHRHHAIDAVVVALTDRGSLRRMTVAAKRADQLGRRLLIEFPPPWDGFVEEVAARARTLVVSHKPDTSWQDALHNDTAYGPIKGARAGEPNVVVRRPIVDLADKDSKKIRVRDPVLRARVLAAMAEADMPTRRRRLSDIKDAGGQSVSRVRTVETQIAVVHFKDRKTGQHYKSFKRDGNHRFELWRLPDGSLRRHVVSTFDAAQEHEAKRSRRAISDSRPHPAAKLVVRLHGSDMVACGDAAHRKIYVVKQISENELALAEHHEAGQLSSRNRDNSDGFKFLLVKSVGKLKELELRKVFVTPDGRVFDHGPVP